MEYFGANDVTLGNFLERYCLRGTYKCPEESCEAPMLQHTRYFAHANMRVVVTMERLSQPIPNPNPEDSHAIMMWSWCKECSQITPIIPMSTTVCHGIVVVVLVFAIFIHFLLSFLLLHLCHDSSLLNL
jgi:1-phosphatidylinositol-3-phosphate 5-kinase